MDLPLVGRDQELQDLASSTGDVVLTGPPGVGKTRLAVALNDVVFADPDSAEARLADDIRWVNPAVVVVDDAGAALEQLRRVVRLRRAESDILHYQVVAVCWPDETTEIASLLADPTVMEVDLFERADVNRILEAMGLRNSLARREILDQAEGRPGWAVVLADILLTTSDSDSLLSGRALLGEAVRYMRRAQIPSETFDTLSLVGLLGSVSEWELDRLAQETGVARITLVSNLRHAADGGIVDVTDQYLYEQERSLRVYAVRPPMLADALVAERIFDADVPAVDLDGLLQRWPDRIGSIARASIAAARIGSPAARAAAERFFRVAIGSEHVSGSERLELAECFARLTPDAAEEVLGLVQDGLHTLFQQEQGEAHRFEPLVSLCTLIARWYQLPGAVMLMLEAAQRDSRETNPHPGHPLRQLSDLVQEFHPELPLPTSLRRLVAATLEDWMNQQGDSVESWRVYANVMRSILSFDLGATMAAPENPMTVQLTYGQLPPAEMAAIYTELWPQIKQRLAEGAPVAVRDAIDVAADWLRTGAGFPGQFGYQPSAEAASTANELGHSLLTDLEALVTGHPGLAAYLRQTADRFDHQIQELDAGNSEAAFFTEVDVGTDWRAEIEGLQQSIRQAVSSWLLDDPLEVMERLTTIQQELELAGAKWPDRVQMAFGVLAEQISDLVPWIEVALDIGLFPAAGPLLEAAVANGAELGTALWEQLLSNPGSRWTAVGNALKGDVSNRVLALVLRELQPSDYRLLESMFLRGELSDNRARLLLGKTSDSTTGAVAAAMFQGGRRDASWSPGEMGAEWLRALEHLDFGATAGLDDYVAAELVEYLARTYPDHLVRLIKNRLRAAENGQVYRALTHSSWDRLHLLPHNAKTDLWQEFSDRPMVRWLLGQHLLGTDAEWLEELLDSGAISADRALDLYSGLGPHPNIEEVARILVPKGVDPRAVASLAQSGTWMGEESARYASLVERFQGYAESNDPSVAAVGQAGVEIFEEAQHAAEEKERIRRVRGEL